MRLDWTFIALTSLVSSGCASDYQFHLVDVDAVDEIVPVRVEIPDHPPVPPAPQDPEDPPDPQDPPNPNWPPNTGNMPDLYFAIAWSNSPCHQDDIFWADGGAPQEQQSDLWLPCDARNVAVVDMFGQVIDEFIPEGVENSPGVEFLQLVNAGPGQFLHVFHRYEYDPLADSDGFYAGVPWEAWRADSYTGEHEMVATWDYETQQAYLPQAGRYLDVGGTNSHLQVGVLPTDPDFLVTWQGQYTCDPAASIQPLQTAHMFDGSVLSQGWQPEEFLPEEIRDQMDNPMGWNMDLSLTEDGDLSALFGVTTGGCSGLPEDEATMQLVSWTPTQQTSWFAPTETGWQPQAATYAGWRGTGALNLLGDFGVPRWRMTSPTGVFEGDLSSSLDGYRPGPLIDPQGPTFTVAGTDPETYDGDSLDFYHQGELVWSIDTLRFGLQDRRVFMADVILLSQRPEEDGD